MKIMRLSGLPVNTENIEKFTAEWQAEFDILKAKHGNDMLSLQKDLAVCEKGLQGKYQTTEDVPYAGTEVEMKALVEKFECPIMIAKSRENPEEIVYVLCDQAFA